MPPTLEDGLRALREAAEQAKTIRIDLTDDYLARIEKVEALPQNQSGVDKSWVWRADQEFREVFVKARSAERRR
jgi:hypothetical protein